MKKYVKPTNPKKATTNQPIKGNSPSTKKHTTSTTKNNTGITKQKVFKSQVITPTKDKTIKESVIRRNDTPKERKHPEYGTSKLETKFAKEFLEKLGIRYETQFKAESIGRYYDFYLTDYQVLIECDGDFYHSYGLVYEQMSPMQKKNKRVDEQKDKWALHHRIPLIRIWEHDINKNPEKVMKMLKEELPKYKAKYNKELEKKNRPK